MALYVPDGDDEQMMVIERLDHQFDAFHRSLPALIKPMCLIGMQLVAAREGRIGFQKSQNRRLIKFADY